MTTERIKEIQQTTGYPDSVSVQQALLQVWNEVEQESNRLEKLSYASPASSGVQNGGLRNKVKNFYAYKNEWKVWSDRDKLYWTVTIIILIIIAVLCA